MKIVTVRRISQVFFFTMFAWFCVVTSIGEEYWQLRGWPVNWFIQLDPLAAAGTMLTTHSLYKPLLWALATVIITIIFGRFFCSWLCPFGSLHHFVSFLASRKKTALQKIAQNNYRKAQSVKYLILILLAAMMAFPSLAGTLQTGLLDPIPLITRAFNLMLLPIFDRAAGLISVTPRFYQGSSIIFVIFLSAVLLNLVIPRFYCRFICPLGAMFAILSRFSLWRIGKKTQTCSNCLSCNRNCQGGCEPAGKIRISECILCFNCLDDCSDELISYQRQPSLAGEITNPDISRRGFTLSLFSGLLGLGAIRLSNSLGANWHHKTIRPPGSLDEEEFLKRCIKCSQCMRICPTNVLQPAGLEAGLEALWTPVLNNRIGSSGCQLNCVACGSICPTSAIRPISLDEKLGRGEFAQTGPIKIGTAFLDRPRCLPWQMDKPCIVCEENCPVSPKAIYTREFFETIRDGFLTVQNANGWEIQTPVTNFPVDAFATGDYYCAFADGLRLRISANTQNTIILTEKPQKAPGKNDIIEIQVRLQRPFIDIEKCTGCGICEHECPVSGKRAIRVSAEGQSRSTNKALLLKR
jgi:polyferredoxin